MRGALLIVAGAALSLAGCGKEIGRIPLRDIGEGEAQLDVTAGKKLSMWTSLDVKYSGAFAARYAVEVVQDGAVVGKVLCDPLDVSTKVNSRETSFNDNHSISWNGKMRCDLPPPPKSGPATVRAKLSIAPRPVDLKINDISLVVKE